MRGMVLDATSRTAFDRISPKMNGLLKLRFLGTRYFKNYTDERVNPAYDTVGSNSADDRRHEGREVDLFLSVSNLEDKDPPVVATGPGGFPYASVPTNPVLYDVLGRTFRAGVRFSM